MRIHHGMLGKYPAHGDGRIRSYLANEELGARAATIHENVLNPGAVVPLHLHEVEEVIVCLEGQAECALEGQPPQAYAAGSVLIIPPGTRHTIRNTGTVPMRQICFMPARSAKTQWMEPEGRLE